MEHMAWKGPHQARLQGAEYPRRHAEIWPEMVKVLKDAGIFNYSNIFTATMSCSAITGAKKGVAYAEKSAVRKPCCRSLEQYMKDILGLEMDPNEPAKLEQVFRLD